MPVSNERAKPVQPTVVKLPGSFFRAGSALNAARRRVSSKRRREVLAALRDLAMRLEVGTDEAWARTNDNRTSEAGTGWVAVEEWLAWTFVDSVLTDVARGAR